MKKIQLVLFDLGNVLVRFTPDSFWDALGFDTETRKPYFEGVKEASVQFESGAVNTKRFFNELERIFDGRFQREQLRRAVASVLTDPIPEMEGIVSRTTQRVSTALVSNTNEFHYNYCMEAIPAMKMLPRHHLSYKLGVMKPRPEFYLRVLASEKRKPGDTIFIDDVKDNVEGAKDVGMIGILFRSAKETEGELQNHGVL